MAKSSQDTSKTQSFARSTSLRTNDKNLSFAALFEASQKKVSSLRRNQEVTGKVVSVSPQEVSIDIGAKSEGIVSGRELSAVSDLVSKLTVGDTVDATVLYPENDAGQVVLSLRKLSGEKRWAELEEKKENSEDIEVVALEVNRGGVICDYLGIHGFLPSSQLIKAPSKLTDLIGKSLTARVIEVDRNSNRLILSQKSPNKRDLDAVLKLLAKVNIGDKVSGIVSAVLPFGIFVEIDLKKVENVSTGRNTQASNVSEVEGQKGEEEKAKLEGLVHISELSWEKTEDPGKFFKVGDEVEVLVIAKDETTGRLNLSIKQLQEDPFGKVSEKYTKDLEVSGIVSRVTPFGVFVNLPDGMEGLVHISKIPPNENFEVGQKVDCSVEAVDTKSRRISLVPVVLEKPILYR